MSAASAPSSKPYDDRTDAEVREGLRRICRTSRSDDEVRRRIREELGYPYADPPISSVSDSGRYVCVDVTIHGPSGDTISV